MHPYPPNVPPSRPLMAGLCTTVPLQNMPPSSPSILREVMFLHGTAVGRRLDSGGGALRASSRASSSSLRHFGCSPTLTSFRSAFLGRRLARSPSLRTFPLPSPYGLSCYALSPPSSPDRTPVPFAFLFCLSLFLALTSAVLLPAWLGFSSQAGFRRALGCCGFYCRGCGVIFC